jgi:hydrogenase nickel incorporation protein HypB
VKSDPGEDAKIVERSVTECEDQPSKHRGIFRKAELMHVRFDPKLALENERRIHPDIEIIEISCTTGTRLEQSLAWLAGRAECENGQELKRKGNPRLA